MAKKKKTTAVANPTTPEVEEEEETSTEDLNLFDENAIAEKMVVVEDVVDDEPRALCVVLQGLDEEIILADSSYESAEHMNEARGTCVKTFAKNLREVVNKAKDGLIDELERITSYEILDLKSQERFQEADVIKKFWNETIKKMILESKEDKKVEEPDAATPAQPVATPVATPVAGNSTISSGTTSNVPNVSSTVTVGNTEPLVDTTVADNTNP